MLVHWVFFYFGSFRSIWNILFMQFTAKFLYQIYFEKRKIKISAFFVVRNIGIFYAFCFRTRCRSDIFLFTFREKEKHWPCLALKKKHKPDLLFTFCFSVFNFRFDYFVRSDNVYFLFFVRDFELNFDFWFKKCSLYYLSFSFRPWKKCWIRAWFTPNSSRSLCDSPALRFYLRKGRRIWSEIGSRMWFRTNKIGFSWSQSPSILPDT